MSYLLPVPHPVIEDRNGQPWYRWHDTLVPPSTADLYSARKRLTDPELAAEWQQSQRHMAVAVICTKPNATTEIHRTETLHRFAKLPHYDEEDQ